MGVEKSYDIVFGHMGHVIGFFMLPTDSMALRWIIGVISILACSGCLGFAWYFCYKGMKARDERTVVITAMVANPVCCVLPFFYGLCAGWHAGNCDEHRDSDCWVTHEGMDDKLDQVNLWLRYAHTLMLYNIAWCGLTFCLVQARFGQCNFIFEPCVPHCKRVAKCAGRCIDVCIAAIPRAPSTTVVEVQPKLPVQSVTLGGRPAWSENP